MRYRSPMHRALKPAHALLTLSGLPMGATLRRLSAAPERYNAIERCQTKIERDPHITAALRHLRAAVARKYREMGWKGRAGRRKFFVDAIRNSEYHMDSLEDLP